MTHRSERKIPKNKDSKSFYSSLLLSFLAVAITCTLLLGLFLTGNYMESAVRSAEKYNGQLLSQTNYAIDEMNRNVERLSGSLFANTSVTAFLTIKAENPTATALASQTLRSQLVLLPYIESIYLYNSNIDLLYCSKTGFQQSLEECGDEEMKAYLDNEEFYEKYHGEPVPAHKNSQTGSYEVFSYYYTDRYSGNNGRRSAIVINVYASTLTDSIQSMKDRSGSFGTSFVLLDQNRQYLTSVLDSDFSLDSQGISELPQLEEEDFSTDTFSEINDVLYFQTCTNANENGWYLLNFIPVRLVFQNLISAALLGCLILITIFLFSFFVCRYFAKRLNSPVETITRQLKEQGITAESFSSGPREFQMIVSALANLQESNQALRTLQNKSRNSLTQAFLYKLVTNRHTDSPLLLHQELEQLNLTHLVKSKLCMAILKIDRYQEFLTERNPDELWALRFAVVNITEELTSAVVDCNAFSCDNDKFVLLMNLDPSRERTDFEKEISSVFRSIQENISTYLQFTVSIAYSTIFQGLDSLPVVFKNLENALTLKMRLGHGAVISPYLEEDLDTESLQLSSKALYPLLDRLIEGQYEESVSLYEKMTQNLFFCSYDEILPALIHLIYSIYERMAEKYPMLKDELTDQMKSVLVYLENAETGVDIQNRMKDFFQSICESVQKLREDPANENAAVTAQKIAQIIQEEYTNPTLCLCSVADKIGLSPNYTGHIFKQYMQKSIAQYILDLRMEKLAYYLQTTDLPLNKILDQIGMEKNNYFYTRFKKYFGMSLGEYRQQFQNAPGREDDENA